MRRTWAVPVSWYALAAWLGTAAALAQPAAGPVTAVGAMGMTGGDMERSVDFYQHWQTVLLTADAEALARALRGGPCLVVSPAVAAPADRELGVARGFLARDPDGHALAVIER